MQNMEIVVVNLEPGKPMYTEAVFPDPEVRSIFADREEEARTRRLEARSHNHLGHHQSVNCTTNNSDNGQQRDPSNNNQNYSGSISSGEVRHVRISATDEEWFVFSFPGGNSQGNPGSVHPHQTVLSTQQSLTVPVPIQQHHSNQQEQVLPLASHHRYHPDEELEEWWLSSEPTPTNSPNPSPINSPIIQQIGKKWRNKSLARLSGCNTCRGDLAILSHQRPELREASFLQVVYPLFYSYPSII